MLIIEDNDDSPEMNHVIDIITYLSHLKYTTANMHEEIGCRLARVASDHFDRASRLCKIEKQKGNPTLEQLKLLGDVIGTFNDEERK